MHVGTHATCCDLIAQRDKASTTRSDGLGLQAERSGAENRVPNFFFFQIFIVASGHEIFWFFAFFEEW
jgi:hypothetical protein